MGTTVLNQARLFSFPTDDGRIGYVMAEETYEKKEGTRSASWCVMRIGCRDQIIDRIFGLASSIPGGTLKTKSSSAKSFIASTLKLLDSPLRLERTDLSLGNSENDFYDAVTTASRSAVQQILIEHGKADLASQIALSPKDGGAKSIPIDLKTDLDLVAALTKRRGDEEAVVLPWRIISSVPFGYAPGVVEHAVGESGQRQGARPIVQILNTGLGGRQEGTSPVLLCKVNGQPLIMGKDYEIERELIQYAGKQETAQPGLYKSLLTELSKIQADKAQIPLAPDVVFDVDATQAPPWVRDSIAGASQFIRGTPSLRFQVSIAEIQQVLDQAGDGSEADKWARFTLPTTFTNANARFVKILLPQDENNEAESPPMRERGG